MKDPHVLKGTLVTLALSTVTVAVLLLFGIAKTEVDAGDKLMRDSALGQNPNELAGFMALGMLVLIGLVFGRNRIIQRTYFLAWPLLAVVALGIVKTGSRGGIIALAAGLFIFMFQGESLRSQLKSAMLVLLAVAFVAAVSYNSDTVRTRWEATLQGGSMAHREHVFPAAWKLFEEKPLWGWGPIRNLYAIGSQGGMEHGEQDPHNVFLWILTEAGLLGFLPFCGGLLLCLYGAWKMRHGPHGVLPLAMMVTLLVFNMSGSWLYRKQFWLILAYVAAATGQYVAVQARKRTAPRRIGATV